jgi:hypothetical protein
MYCGKSRPKESRTSVPTCAAPRTRRPQTLLSAGRNTHLFEGGTRPRWRGGRSVVGTPRWRQPGAVGSSQRRPNSSGGRREFEIAASTRSDRLARHGTARSPAQAPTPSIGTQKTPSRCFYIVAMQYNHNSVSLNAQKSIVARVGGSDLSDQVTACRRRVAKWKL